MPRARSLRTRLVAITLLLLAVASIVVGLITTLSVRGFVLGRLDEDLRTTSRVFDDRVRPDGLGPSAGPGGLLPADGPRPPGDSLFGVVVNGQVQSCLLYTSDAADE